MGRYPKSLHWIAFPGCVPTLPGHRVSPAALHRWLKKADEEDDPKTRAAKEESAALREAKKRIKLLEQEAEVMRRAVAYLSRDINPK